MSSLHLDDYPAAQKLAERIIAYAIGYGALFEVNAAALRKKWKTTYPAEDVVEVCTRVSILARQGVCFNCFHIGFGPAPYSDHPQTWRSDGSRGPRAVGLNYDRVARYLRSVKVVEL